MAAVNEEAAMPTIDNKELTRRVRAEVARRNIDASMLNVSVLGTTAHFTGFVGKLRSHEEVDLKEEMEVITHLVQMHCGIREVVWETKVRV